MRVRVNSCIRVLNESEGKQLYLGTKCNSLTQQFIVISTTTGTWVTCFDSYWVIFRHSNNTDSINKVVKRTVGSPMLTK